MQKRLGSLDESETVYFLSSTHLQLQPATDTLAATAAAAAILVL